METSSSKQSQPEAPLPDQMIHGNENGNCEDHDISIIEGEAATRVAARRRPWSTHGFKSILSPSPTITESRRSSKDDLDVGVGVGPRTPQRPAIAPRGLSLQMPPRDFSSTSTANLAKQITVSPKPEPAASYPSPASVLPRRSRGLDFSRAATNLHHSTLAESSPESSPIIGSRSSFLLRKGLYHSSSNNTNVPDSPSNISTSLWGALASGDRSGLSSSVGSSNMMEYDLGISSSDSDAIMDGEDDDTIHTTPQHCNTVNGFTNPFLNTLGLSPGGDGVGEFSPAARNLRSYQRARVKSRGKRWSQSSASGQSSVASPGPPSPPLLRSVESGLSNPTESSIKKEINSRRESLSLGTSDMQLSDIEQSDGGGNLSCVRSHEDVPIPTPVTPTIDDRRNVVRRAVTRRTNMLPKSKGFARVKADLLEECAPIDTEVKREAEVVRQVRESDTNDELSLQTSQPTTRASSPSLAPVTLGPHETVDQMSEDSLSRRSSNAFANQAIKNACGPSFWTNIDQRLQTPPPAMPREGSPGMSDDASMENQASSVRSTTPQQNTVKASLSQEALQSSKTMAFEVPRKGNKRLRDEDLDPNYFKRRAVSPGLSLQNSPVLPQSPLHRDSSWWGTPKSNRDVTTAQFPGERTNSHSSAGSVVGTPAPSKRVGLQGMTDTHDSLMNMSIE